MQHEKDRWLKTGELCTLSSGRPLTTSILLYLVEHSKGEERF